MQGFFEILGVTSRRLISVKGWHGAPDRSASLPYSAITGVELDTSGSEPVSLFGLFKTKEHAELKVDTRAPSSFEGRIVFWSANPVEQAQIVHDRILHHVGLLIGEVAPQSKPDVDEGLIDQLERLALLRDSGALTGEEFQAAKRKLLSE